MDRRSFVNVLTTAAIGSSGTVFAEDSVSDFSLDILYERARLGGGLILKPGKYRFELSSKSIQVLSDFFLKGAPEGGTVIDFFSSSQSVDKVFSVGSSCFVVENLDIRVNLAAPHSRFLQFEGKTSGHKLMNCSITGVARNAPHGVLVSDNAIVENVEFHNVKFSKLKFGIFSTNNFNGVARNWIFDRCEFLNNQADDLEFNSSDNPAITWSGVKINRCKFLSGERERSSDFGFAIGCDSVFDLVIDNCFFENYPREAVHIEDYCKSIRVINSEFLRCRSGIVVHQNKTEDVIISANVFDGVFSGNPLAKGVDSLNVGVHIANPGIFSSCTAVNVFGNNISGYDIGVVSPVDRAGYVNNNIVRECRVGVFFPGFLVGSVKNNTLYKCEFSYWIKSGGGVGDIVDNCGKLYFGRNSPSFYLKSFVFKKNIDVIDYKGKPSICFDLKIPLGGFKFVADLPNSKALIGSVEDLFFVIDKNGSRIDALGEIDNLYVLTLPKGVHARKLDVVLYGG